MGAEDGKRKGHGMPLARCRQDRSPERLGELLLHAIISNVKTSVSRCSIVLLCCCAIPACGGDATSDDAQMEPERRAAVQEARGYYADLSECLTERGFPTTYDAENIQMQVSVDDAQESAFTQAQAGCQELYGLPPEVPPFPREK